MSTPISVELHQSTNFFSTMKILGLSFTLMVYNLLTCKNVFYDTIYYIYISSRHINKVENVHSTTSRLFEMVCKSWRNKKLIVLVTFLKLTLSFKKKYIAGCIAICASLKKEIPKKMLHST